MLQKVYMSHIWDCACMCVQIRESEAVDMKVDDSRVWVPAEEPIANPDFLLDSKIWEICQQLPIHWIHPSPMKGESRGAALPLNANY